MAKISMSVRNNDWDSGDGQLSRNDALQIMPKIFEALDLLGEIQEKIEVITIGCCWQGGMVLENGFMFRIVLFDDSVHLERIKFETEFTLLVSQFRLGSNLVVYKLVTQVVEAIGIHRQKMGCRLDMWDKVIKTCRMDGFGEITEFLSN
jgi:hypothetical protein